MHHIRLMHPGFNKILYSALIFVAILLFSPASSVARDCTNLGCNTSVFFTGVYAEETCEIVINGGINIDVIQLPIISTQTLRGAGSEAGSKTFTVGLKKCPINRNIQLKFVSNLSQADNTTGNLLNNTGVGYSRNTQIRLRKKNGSQIKIDDLTSAQNYYIPLSGGVVTHDYIANYYSSGLATSGQVRATAGIELFYK
ncbi:fimbrial protein [Erwinia sorbitola]|uniref:Fimbrial protein n=1 Tax=Erwinia sorbitola TaxID=2681984 RepID=A0A6I6E7S6_9GAMM|nr:fimbrial protein [Erwinia sorbitola]QGU85834.1 fimbrial protein [Erwinia sorbitola]